MRRTLAPAAGLVIETQCQRDALAGRGPNKAPTKKLVSLRLSPEVIEHFKSTGSGWPSRIDVTLRKAVKRKGFLIRLRPPRARELR
ncbi:BrnA antitoxin family protein [Bradyrhizobium sp.]|uniref:BrnA antitoxin family protein n=1 Tax=Bradyrhizobium sp. TaxID=376 RepID=UPI003C752D63